MCQGLYLYNWIFASCSHLWSDISFSNSALSLSSNLNFLPRFLPYRFSAHVARIEPEDPVSEHKHFTPQHWPWVHTFEFPMTNVTISPQNTSNYITNFPTTQKTSGQAKGTPTFPVFSIMEGKLGEIFGETWEKLLKTYITLSFVTDVTLKWWMNLGYIRTHTCEGVFSSHRGTHTTYTNIIWRHVRCMCTNTSLGYMFNINL